MNADAIFTSSTPTTRPDWCDSVGHWRCEHVDELRTVIESIDTDAYAVNHRSTPSGRKQLFAGIRDNRDSNAHHNKCERLLVALRGMGLRVKRQRGHGRTTGVIVTDRMTKAEA